MFNTIFWLRGRERSVLKVEFLFIFVALVLWVVSLCVCLEYANVSLFRPLCNRLMAAPLRSTITSRPIVVVVVWAKESKRDNGRRRRRRRREVMHFFGARVFLAPTDVLALACRLINERVLQSN